jgi:uncharacterized protein YchJ
MQPPKKDGTESLVGPISEKKGWKDVTPVITASKYHETRSRLFCGQFTASKDTQRPNAKCKCGSGKKYKFCCLNK